MLAFSAAPEEEAGLSVPEQDELARDESPCSTAGTFKSHCYVNLPVVISVWYSLPMPHCTICNGCHIPSLTFDITSKPVHRLRCTAYRFSEGDSAGHRVNVGTNRYSTWSCIVHESVDITLNTVFKFITSLHLPLIYCHKLQWTDSGATLGLICITKPILWNPLTKLIQPLLGPLAFLQSTS